MATEKYSLMEIGFFPCALHQFFFSLTKPLLFLVIEMQINGNSSLFCEHVKRQGETATKLLKNPEPCWDYALPSSKGFFTIYLHLSRLEMFFTSEGKGVWELCWVLYQLQLKHSTPFKETFMMTKSTLDVRSLLSITLSTSHWQINPDVVSEGKLFNVKRPLRLIQTSNYRSEVSTSRNRLKFNTNSAGVEQ